MEMLLFFYSTTFIWGFSYLQMKSLQNKSL